jgi:3-hydroxyacyl-CoA dehydrogenase
MKEKGYLGVKDGRGFYEYGPEDAEHWERLRHEQAWSLFTKREK